MNWTFVKYFVKDRIGYISLERPEKRNALNKTFIDELKEAFQKAKNDKNCKLIILQAIGKTFCSGADLAYLKDLITNSYSQNLQDSKNLMSLFKQIYELPKIIIAKVQGDAIAGGCGLISLCDIIVSNEEAKFGYPEVKIGFVPAIVSHFLIKKIGLAKSNTLLLSGKIINSQEAKNIGLIDEIVLDENLEKYVSELAKKLIKSTSSESIVLTKKIINKVDEKLLEEASIINAKSRESDDFKKGITAFLNKKSVKW
ncbi:MAG: methylglutaconyl-CoA hydratase [Flavobacteriales bacterium]|nr:methylglutaconyl-CoA hydratase [Flavobacteriales bacterium]